MNSRIVVAVVGVPVLVLLALLAPAWLLALILALLAGCAGFELLRCCSGGSRWNYAAAAAAALNVGLMYIRPGIVLYALYFELAAAFLAGVLAAGRIPVQKIMMLLFAAGPIAWSFSAILRIEASELTRCYLLLPFILSFCCDTFAYLAGTRLGKHKLAPYVSPHKTVEGSIGGLLGCVLGGLVFALVIRAIGHEVSLAKMLLLSLLGGVFAQLGDLSFSLIKREFGIKDYGRLFLEHGGTLDRFDSVLFVLPLTELFLLILP